MSVSPAPSPVFQGLGAGGVSIPGGKLYTYVAGSTTPQATYVDSTQTTQNPNPVILNANGQATIWLVNGETYKLVLTDASGNQIYSVDQVQSALTAFNNNLTIGPPSTTGTSALIVNGTTNAPALQINGATTAGESQGLAIEAGTNSTDSALSASNAAGTSLFLKLFGDGGLALGSPTGGDKGLGSVNAQSVYAQGGVVSLGNFVVIESSTTSRSTATLSNDSVFTVALPSAGIYQFRLDAQLTNTAVGSGTITYNMNYSGTFTAGAGGYGGSGGFAGSSAANSGNAISSTVAGSAVNTVIGGLAGGTATAGSIIGTLVATAAGTLAIAWGSSVTSMLLGGGSLVVTRIA